MTAKDEDIIELRNEIKELKSEVAKINQKLPTLKREIQKSIDKDMTEKMKRVMGH